MNRRGIGLIEVLLGIDVLTILYCRWVGILSDEWFRIMEHMPVVLLVTWTYRLRGKLVTTEAELDRRYRQQLETQSALRAQEKADG